MNWEEYSDWRRSRDIHPGDKLLECHALGLASEAGEVAGKVCKELRDGRDLTDDIISELGDVLWFLNAMMDDMDITLEELIENNVQKIEGRAMRGTMQGSGDNR